MTHDIDALAKELKEECCCMTGDFCEMCRGAAALREQAKRITQLEVAYDVRDGEAKRLAGTLSAVNDEDADDTKRLDWLEPRIGCLDVCADDMSGRGYGFNMLTNDRTMYHSLRAAIDAARAAGVKR